MTRFLTVKQAADRVERSTRTVEDWIAHDGLQVYKRRVRVGGRRVRLVREDELLAVLRLKLLGRRKHGEHAAPT